MKVNRNSQQSHTRDTYGSLNFGDLFLSFHNPSAQIRYPPPSSQIAPYNPAPTAILGGEAAKTTHRQEALHFKGSFLEVGGLPPTFWHGGGASARKQQLP